MTIAIEQLYRLLNRFEQGPDGGAALSAYICPAGVWTIAYGCTKHPDGSSIKEGDTISPDQVYPYTEAAVERVISDIRATIKRPLNQYQEAAIASFVFNRGIGNLRKSTQLLPAIEAGRWEDAATALGEFVRAWGHYDGKWHRQALLGLRIRRYAEGCMLLGLDFDDACNADNIGMPKRREWQAEGICPDGSKGRWYDVLLDGATEFNTIEELARTQPLPSLDLILTNEAEPAQSVAQGKAGQPEPTPNPVPAGPAPQSKPATSTVSGPPVAGPVAAPKAPQAPTPLPVPSTKPPALPTSVGTKPPSPNTKMPEHVPYRIDPNAGLKPMEETERFIGAALMLFGTFARVIMANGAALSGATGVVVVAILDMMKSPTNLAILVSLIALVVTGVGWLIGVIIDKLGLKIKKRGEATSTQAMY